MAWGCVCASAKQGTTAPEMVIFLVLLFASASTSALDPTATIRPADTAIASARGCPGSSVRNCPMKIASGAGDDDWGVAKTSVVSSVKSATRNTLDEQRPHILFSSSVFLVALFTLLTTLDF